MVIVNLLITLVNLLIAWKIWQVIGVMANFTQTLKEFELMIHVILKSAPEVLNTGEISSQNFRAAYEKLTRQMQLLEQVILIVSLAKKLGQGQFREKKGILL